ncbi:interferon-induced GTP-binding protein Mx2-like isoform X2 [Ascaphus truei]
MDNFLCSQYEEKIRPCIDLIDSLRALGVERDLALPAIAVIGDQSSGKSSVLEALSGVTLPRGSGIVTRCPLELKLKKARKETDWCGKLIYRDQEIILTSALNVDKEIRKAQNFIAGDGNGISDELITLEVTSPDVPDLTLIDLPGITRVALPNQPKDIGDQIKKMIKKYIIKQETINLVVVPSNVDIATTEALEMARNVDPSGERTLGILTKPDLVDRGAEQDIVSVVRNLVYTLEKGYMIVKCRGQQEIQDNLSLHDALQKEKTFFEEHEHFSVLLEEGNATIPLLAEKLTNELVAHIIKTLPTLEDQIKARLQEAEQKLKNIGIGVPDSDTERLTFLIDKIQRFTNEIIHATQGEDDVTNGSLKLFTSIRKNFNSWEHSLNKTSKKFQEKLREDMDLYENRYRGRELTGFINYRTFESILREKIQTLEDPAVDDLKTITEKVRSTFTKICTEHFLAFPFLQRAAKSKIEDIGEEQEQEAEKTIRTQFKMEQVIYCQDDLYGNELKEARDAHNESEVKAAKALGQTPVAKATPCQSQISVTEMTYHINAYFKGTTDRLSNQIPLIIQYYVLRGYADRLQNEMMHLVQDRDQFIVLLQEKQDLSKQRQALKDRIQRLNGARLRLAKFPS